LAAAESAAAELCGCDTPECTKVAGVKFAKALGAVDKSKLKEKDLAKMSEVAQKASGCLSSPGAGGSSFNNYIAKSKTTEATEFIKKMADGARAYYMDGAASQGSLVPVAKQFPGPSVGPTPKPGSCCEDGKKCAPNPDSWSAPTWQALNFGVFDPHYFSYKYEVAADGRSITASAIGDLDCDGTFSTYSLTATIEEGGDAPMLAPKIVETNPGE